MSKERKREEAAAMTRNLTSGSAFSRRQALRVPAAAALAVAGALAAAPRRAGATPQEAKKLLAELADGAAPRKGRVMITVPAITDQGALVPISVSVDSPMTADDHVKAIHIFAERNTVPRVGTYYLGPANPRAEFSTRIRVKTSQVIIAAAVMSDGSVFVGKARCKIVSGTGGCG